MSKKILIINGPNLNLLGTREPEVYGDQGLDEIITALQTDYNNHHINHVQSNWEGGIIDALQNADGKYEAVLLNAGGFTHTSVAIRDAVSAISVPVIEIHMSNIAAREEFRHKSLLTSVCVGSIMGFGTESYRLGVEAILKIGRA